MRFAVVGTTDQMSLAWVWLLAMALKGDSTLFVTTLHGSLVAVLFILCSTYVCILYLYLNKARNTHLSLYVFPFVKWVPSEK